MPTNDSRTPNTVRTGAFGVILVVAIMLVAAGYTALPFYPQGKTYEAFFSNAAGVSGGNPVTVYGHQVGSVSTVELAERSAKVTFTVDPAIRVGDQTLVAIATDTVLGQRSLSVTPAGAGSVTAIPLGRTTTPYTLNSALQDLGGNAAALDQERFAEALDVIGTTLQDATPQLRGALEGITALSRSVNARDQQLGELLARARSLSDVLAGRAGQISTLIDDGNQLFAELAARRQAIAALVGGIGDLSRQLSGFVADNERVFGPALTQLNLVLENLLGRQAVIEEALRRLPPFATALGEVVASGPGFMVNVFNVPPAAASAVLLDTYFQPGKLPDSLADMLRGFITDRAVIRPRSP